MLRRLRMRQGLLSTTQLLLRRTASSGLTNNDLIAIIIDTFCLKSRRKFKVPRNKICLLGRMREIVQSLMRLRFIRILFILLFQFRP